MNRNYYYDDSIGFADDVFPVNSFRLTWPVNEVVLMAAFNSGMNVREIADEYDVPVAEVVDLCERYDLDWS